MRSTRHILFKSYKYSFLFVVDAVVNQKKAKLNWKISTTLRVLFVPKWLKVVKTFFYLYPTLLVSTKCLCLLMANSVCVLLLCFSIYRNKQAFQKLVSPSLAFSLKHINYFMDNFWVANTHIYAHLKCRLLEIEISKKNLDFQYHKRMLMFKTNLYVCI